LLAHVLAELAYFMHHALLIQQAIDARIELLGLERFGHVIIGAQPRRFEDNLGIVQRREQDHRDFRFDLLQPLQRLQATEA